MLQLVDRAAFRAADLVVADTEAHAAFFRRVFGLPDERVDVALVGAEEALFRPGLAAARAVPGALRREADPAPRPRDDPRGRRARPGDPLQGRRATASSAPLLDDRPPNVEHVHWIPYAELPDAYRAPGARSGSSARATKAARVIPNKAFQALACACPVITADTPAARELLTDGVDALLVPPGDPDALAHARTADRRLSRSSRTGSPRQAGRRTRRTPPRRFSGARWRSLLERAVAAR